VKVSDTVAGVASVIVSIAPCDRRPDWCAWLAARACCAKAMRAASGCERNFDCQRGSRVCARNAW